MHDLVVRGGTVVTACDMGACDVAVRDGRIAGLGLDLGPAREVIDATGLWVLPGGIDSHVHMAQASGPGVTMADGFATGTASALWGGTTTVMPFCIQAPGQSLRAALADYHALASGACATDVAFHLVVTDPTPQALGQDLPALIAAGYSSLKLFMTYEGLRLNDAQILACMDVARSAGATVMVHCENEDAIRYLVERAERAGDLAPAAHARTRPLAVEREAAHRALTLAEVVGVPVVIVHVSNGATLEEIARARARGVAVVGETCPQYLVLTAADLEGMDWSGAKQVCSPPPRDSAEQAACWRGLQTGGFELFSSDHCPFRYDDTGKLTPRGRGNFRYIPNGIPGVETRGPILFSEGVVTGRLTPQQFVALTATNHARTYGLSPRKGGIAIGGDADLALWDPKARRRLHAADLHSAADYTPYEGMAITGWPITVILRGQPMIRDGVRVGPAAPGIHLARPPRPGAFA